VKHHSPALPEGVTAALRRYCELLASAPVSVTSVQPAELWERHVEDALLALPLLAGLTGGPLVDVGSGGGSPGIPLALASGRETVLLEARAPRAAFLRHAVAGTGAPCSVVHARSEEHARCAGRDAYSAALARALAPPPVAAELCLPLVRPGGLAVLWTGALDAGAVRSTACAVGGELHAVHDAGGERRLVVLVKLAPTPERFPRRPGMAAKRPLASLPSQA
jgi:16S rRNA (guanine527-N7)-methyltransferase